MITLIHGDNIEESRTALNALKGKLKAKEVRELDGASLEATSLRQSLESQSLFGGEIAVVIENLLSRLGKKTKIAETLIPILCEAGKNTEIILWEGKEIAITTVKKLGKGEEKLFKTPHIMFQFLDTLAPHRSKQALTLYQKLILSTEPSEIVFFMVSRRFRQLLMVGGGQSPDGLQSWQIGRLRSQAKLFSLDSLSRLYKKLLEIDFSIKSGATPFSLSSHIRQFLLSL